MESDDDFQSLSPPEEPSPRFRKLKRLKKTVRIPNDPPVKSVDELLSLPPVDFAKLEALESSKTLGFEESNEPLRSHSPSEGFDEDSELNSGFDGLRFDEEDRRETKRALEFDAADDEFGGERMDRSEGMVEEMADLKADKSEKKRLIEGGLTEKKEKKKRVKSSGDEMKQKTSSNKRREEKERRAYLQQLHGESQRLLRETRDAAFKPIPVMQKPISSVLEKIRRRKLEVSKKTLLSNNNISVAENDGELREVMMDHDSEIYIEEVKVDKLAKVVEEETVAHCEDLESNMDASHVGGFKESVTQSSHENVPSQPDFAEENTPTFRAPVDDTQDLFGDSQTSGSKDELPDGQQNCDMEEVLAPSLLTMNLKFDSAPPDDIFSDKEDNNKENIDPHPHKLEKGCSSPKGDPVKTFVDDEAVEEDDSDNDQFRFLENEEDDGYEDYEELNDMIATEYEEKPIDNDKRNELHQKWLEQQDAAGTDNLLQRLNYGAKLSDTTLLDEEEEEGDNDEEEFSNGAEEDLAPTKHARINSRKAKQIITQMFSDKDDAFLSSDDEETEKRLVKQRLLDKAGEQATLLSPAEDENSREIFGLIKKLNIVPDTKKKSKASSFFDKLLMGGNSNSSSRSSFLGRVSNHSLPSSRKQRSSTVRSFIFGRDDSNSRSSISMAEDSSDTISTENRPTRSFTTKFSNSQVKYSTQSTKITAETTSGTSLFEILKRSSVQSNFCNQDSMVGLTQLAAFKIPKKPIKIQGRT